MYTAVQVLYQLLATMCRCYCSNPNHTKDILPAIVLGLHFLVLNNSLLLLSYAQGETLDKPAMEFAAACAPFFSQFHDAATVSCAATVEEADLTAINAEYYDCAGVAILGDILVGEALCVDV